MSQTPPRHYIIGGGKAGSERLKVLARATWPTSEPFLEAAGLGEGMRCLDVGCGNGEIARRLLAKVGPQGEVVGWDCDARMIEIAGDWARGSRANAQFRVFNIERDSLAEESAYDFAYARFLFSHLKDPARAIRKILDVLKPGGILAVEDVDFRGHFSHPECPAFDRFVQLYEAAGRKKGVDPWIGPKLLAILADAGLASVKMRVALPTFYQGDGKLMALLTMQNIQSALLDAQLATQDEINQIISELEHFTNDPRSIMSLPRLFQLSGIK